MAGKVAHEKERGDASALIRHLHRLVTYGPGDLDVAAAMSAHGYDAVKWAEGQGMLAELVSYEEPGEGCLAQASAWYRTAARAAQAALEAHPKLLAKLGVIEVGTT
jgi:hypothetical protein